jgi:lysophospholipase L1-like esterase
MTGRRVRGIAARSADAIAGVLLAVVLAGCRRDAAESVAPPPHVVRVMPLGDSITEGAAGSATYRYWLWKKLEAAGSHVDFVGSRFGVSDGDARFPDFDQNHEGHWGWTAEQVERRVFGWASDTKPDVVLLAIGINDVAHGEGRQVAGRVAGIIARLRAANPKVTVLLASLMPATPVPLEAIEAVNDALPRVAEQQRRDGTPVVIVDQFTDFDPAVDTYDGIHPNETGEKKLAERWFPALRDVLAGAAPRPS